MDTKHAVLYATSNAISITAATDPKKSSLECCSRLDRVTRNVCAAVLPLLLLLLLPQMLTASHTPLFWSKRS
jgi:hypothetical protein